MKCFSSFEVCGQNSILWSKEKDLCSSCLSVLFTSKQFTKWNILGTPFLRLLLETGPPFYVVIRAKRRSSHLQGKGSTFISQLCWDLEYCSGPGNRTSDLPLCSRALFRLSQSCHIWERIGNLLKNKGSFHTALPVCRLHH